MNINIYNAQRVTEEVVLFDNFRVRRINVTDTHGQTVFFEYTIGKDIEADFTFINKGERNAYKHAAE